MARFSRRHYRAVSPPADTKEAITARIVQRRASELAIEDRQRQFPTITADNFDAASQYQEERIGYHVRKLTDPLCPNHGRSLAEIEKLVRGYIVGGEQNQRFIEDVITWIGQTGEGVWHAAATVGGTTCYCSPCCKARGETPVCL